MFDDLKHLKTLLLKPSYFFENVGEQSIPELFKYWAQISLILAIEVLVISAISVGVFSKYLPFLNIWGLGLFTPLILAIISYLGMLIGFIGVMISAVVIHLVAMIFGCRGYRKTLTVLVFGSTPNVILGGLPIVNSLAGIYTFILQIIGLSKIHKIKWWKVLIIIAIIPGVILMGVIVAGALWRMGVFQTGAPVVCSPCFINFAYTNYADGTLKIRNGPQEIEAISVLANPDAVPLASIAPDTAEVGSDLTIIDIDTNGDIYLTITYTVIESGLQHTDTAIIHN